MLAKNIPISISLLHEQEYRNLYLLMKGLKRSPKSRRAFSERKECKESVYTTTIGTDHRRITLGRCRDTGLKN